MEAPFAQVHAELAAEAGLYGAVRSSKSMRSHAVTKTFCAHAPSFPL
jgi:hypothetical protein